MTDEAQTTAADTEAAQTTGVVETVGTAIEETVGEAVNAVTGVVHDVENLAVDGEQLIDDAQGEGTTSGEPALDAADHPALSVLGEIEAELAAIPAEVAAAISALIAKAKALF